MKHEEMKEMLEKQLQLLSEHSFSSEDRDLVGLTAEMREVIRLLVIGPNPNTGCRNPEIVKVEGQDVPTYQKYWEDRVKTDTKIHRLCIAAVLQGLATLALAATLLLK